MFSAGIYWVAFRAVQAATSLTSSVRHIQPSIPGENGVCPDSDAGLLSAKTTAPPRESPAPAPSVHFQER